MSDKIFITDGSGNRKGAIFYDSASDEIRIASYDSTPVIDGYISVSSAGLTVNGFSDGIEAGTWTPTVTNGGNISSVTPEVGHYMKIGFIVSVSGTLDITLLGAGSIQHELSLPVASDFAAASNAAGWVGSADVSDGSVYASVANDRLVIDGSTASTSVTVQFFAQYEVI